LNHRVSLLRLYRNLSALLVLSFFLPSVSAKETTPEEAQLEEAFRRRTVDLEATYARDLLRAGAWAAQKGLRAEAKEVVATVKAFAPRAKGLKKLRRQLKKKPTTEVEAADLPKLKKSLASRLSKAKSSQAKRLFDLATQCMKLGLFTRSYDLIGEVLELDTDYKKARRILGFTLERKTKTWISNWEASMRKKHFLTKEGWIPKKWKKKWDSGLRNYKGKWVSIEEEKRIRTRNEYNPYRAETEHFSVSTNLGRQVAYEYAVLLEDFYRQFFRVFIGYYDQIAGAKLLFNRAAAKTKHKVKLFPTHKEYLTHIKAEHGNHKLLRESAGFYTSSDKRSRFYWTADLESTLDTMYHEITHQLLAETKGSSSSHNSKGNNWVVEGVAVYAETWLKEDGVWKPGKNTKQPELQRAKEGVRSFRLGEFVRIDNKEFHKEGRGMNYAISGAIAHFFMHYDDEVYKEDFVRFLSAYYAGEVKEGSLVDFIEVEGTESPAAAFARLNEQFVKYVEEL
jgi:hypothetical protein